MIKLQATDLEESSSWYNVAWPTGCFNFMANTRQWELYRETKICELSTYVCIAHWSKGILLLRRQGRR